MNEYCYKPRTTYFTQIGIALGFTIIGLVLGSLISIVVWKTMTHTSIFTLETHLTNPAFAGAIKVMQLLTTLFGFFIPAVAYSYMVSHKPYQYLGFRKTISWKQVLLVIGLVFFALLMSGSLGEINKLIPISKAMAVKFEKAEEEYMKQVAVIASFKSWSDYLMAIVMIGALPAIFEEVFFRGMLQQLFENWLKKPFVAITVTSIIFSLVHASFYGFLARWGLGMVLGYIFYYSRNIWLNILLHFCNNSIAVTALFVSTSMGKKEIPKETIGDSFPVWLIIISATGLYFLFKELKKEGVKIGVQQLPNWQLEEYNPFAEPIAIAEEQPLIKYEDNIHE